MSTSNLHPNAAGYYTNWSTQYPGFGNHYDKVDEVTHDGDDTYIEHSASSTPGITPFLRLGGLEQTGINEELGNSYVEYSQVISRPGGGDWTEGDLDSLEVGVAGIPAIANGLIKDSFNLQDWAEGGHTINSVTVVFVCRKITGKFNFQRCTQVYVEVDYTENIVITPAAVSCISSVVNPAVAIDLPITPSTISCIMSTVAPIVYPIIIIPLAISCIIGAVNPQVIIGPFPAPTAIEIDHQSSLATNVSEAPKFTAVFNGNDSNDVAVDFNVQVAFSDQWGATIIYGSGWMPLSSPGCADGERCEGIIYGIGDPGAEVMSSHPPYDEYYVRFKFRDSLNTESEWSDTVAFKGINRNWALTNYAARCKLYVDTDHADAIPPGWDLPFSFKTGERTIAATNGCFNEAVQASGGFQIDGYGSKLFYVYLSKQDPTHASAFYATYIMESSDGGETWSEPVKIGTVGHYFDTHYFPTLVVDKLGYIHVAYGAHSGYFKYTRSTNAADISSWWTPTTITGFSGTYPVGILVPTKGGTHGRVYWFWRESAEEKDTFVYSDDGGSTWSTVRDFIIDTDASAYRVYCYGYRYDLKTQRLHVAYTHNHTGDVEKGVWYIYSDLDEVDSLSGDYGFNIWHWADGDVAGYSTGASGSAVDYNTGKAISLSDDHLARIFVECLELDASGDPVVFWEQKIIPSAPNNETYLVCATWNGSSWDKHYISDQVNRMLRVRRSSIGLGRDKDNIIRIIMPVRANTWWHFNPTGDLDSVDITRKSEASNYLEVDEGPTDCDEDGSYFDVGTASAGAQASFSSSIGMIDDTREIFTLEIRAIVKHLGTSSSCYLYVEDGSVEDDSNSISITSSSYTEKSATWDINPFTSLAWTESDLDSLQFGIKQAGANEFRVTRMFARAQYTLQSDAEWGASEIYELTSSDNGVTWQMSRELSRNSGIGVPIMNSTHHLHNNRIHVIWSSGFDLFYFTDKRFGLMQFGGDDIRIMYAGVEIDRVLDYANKNETIITFKCQESIPANRRAGPDDYYLYYGNPNEKTAAKSDPHGVYDREFQNWEQYDDNENLDGKDGWTVSGGTALAYASPPSHSNKIGAGELDAECTPSAGNFAMVKTIGSGLTNVQLDIFIWMESSGGDDRAWAEFEDSGGNIFGAGLDKGELRAAYKVNSSWTNSSVYANYRSMNHLRLRITSAGCSAWWNGDEIVFEYSDSLAITSVDKLRLACNALTFFDFSRVGYSWERTDVSDPEVVVQSEEWQGLRIDATLLGRGSDSFIIDATIWGLKMGWVTTIAAAIAPTVVLGSITLEPTATSAVIDALNPTVILGSIVVTDIVSVVISSQDPELVFSSTTATPAATSLVTNVVDPTVIIGSITIIPSATAIIVSIEQPTVILGSITITVTVSTLVSSNDPVVHLGSTSCTPAALVVVIGSFDPTVIQESLNLFPAALSCVLDASDPTVYLGSTVATPSATIVLLSVDDPTIILSSMAISPTAVDARASSVDPTVFISDVIITPTAVTAIISVVNPTIILGSVIVIPASSTAISNAIDCAVQLGSTTSTPVATTVIVGVQSPTVVIGDIVVTPTAISAVSSTSDPELVFSSTSASPTATTAIISVFDPTFIGGSITLSPTALSIRIATVDPSVVIGEATITPSAISVVTTAFNPGVVLGSTTAVPSAIVVIASTSAPSVLYGSTSASPTPITTVISVIDPTVLVGEVIVTPAATSTHISTIDPTLILGSIIVQPTSVSAVLTSENPVVTGGSITLSPTAITMVVDVVDPVVVLASMSIQPVAINVLISTVDPNVIISGINVSPAAVVAIAGVVDPSIILGSVQISPTASIVYTSTSDPILVLGSMSISPEAVDVIAETVDPTFVFGALVITPTSSQMVTVAVAPGVVYSSTVSVPDSVWALASAPAPTVLLTGVVLILPDGRTVIVGQEDRMFTVPADDRGVEVEREDRIFVAPDDDRGVLVSEEDRTVKPTGA